MLPEVQEHAPEIQQGTIETILESVDGQARRGLEEALKICLNILDILRKVDFRSLNPWILKKPFLPWNTVAQWKC